MYARRTLIATSIVALLAVAPSTSPFVQEAGAAVGRRTGSSVAAPTSNPTVTGPITGGLHGRPWFGAPFDPSAYGYSQQEYFFSGSARAYGANAASARYTTRMLVLRPNDPAKFSGNVIVEWNNVSLQVDLPADFDWVYPQVLAQGDAYVQITAQQAGVCGTGLTGSPILSLGPLKPAVCTPLSVKGYDPLRYSPLVHPGDPYSYDIFSQGAQAVRHPSGISPLGALTVQKMIAIGASQSASALDRYIERGADASAAIFDGFVIDADVHDVVVQSSYRVPTLHIWSEESAQPVSSTTGPNHVIWQVAGAPHVDRWGLQHVLSGATSSFLNLPPNSAGQQAALEQSLGAYGQLGPNTSATCAGNSQFPRRYVVDAALAGMSTWVRTGRPAPSAPPLVFTGLAEVTQPLPPIGLNVGIPTSPGPATIFPVAVASTPLALVRDAHGNAVGGLRLPVISVPVASYHGSLCTLLGISVPLPPTTLLQLYPTHDDYVAKMVAATLESVTSRFMTVADGIDLLRRACDSAIPAWGTTPSAQQPAVCHDLEATVGAASDTG